MSSLDPASPLLVRLLVRRIRRISRIRRCRPSDDAARVLVTDGPDDVLFETLTISVVVVVVVVVVAAAAGVRSPDPAAVPGRPPPQSRLDLQNLHQIRVRDAQLLLPPGEGVVLVVAHARGPPRHRRGGRRRQGDAIAVAAPVVYLVEGAHPRR